jgi:hypothetical protein
MEKGGTRLRAFNGGKRLGDPLVKAKAARAVEAGQMTAQEAEERYQLSAEELGVWQRALRSFGLDSRCVDRRHLG